MQVPHNLDQMLNSLQSEFESRKHYVYCGVDGFVGIIMTDCHNKGEFAARYMDDETYIFMDNDTSVRAHRLFPSSVWATEKEARSWLRQKDATVILVNPKRSQVKEILEKYSSDMAKRLKVQCQGGGYYMKYVDDSMRSS